MLKEIDLSDESMRCRLVRSTTINKAWHTMQHLFDIKPADLQAWFERRDIPRYRAGQIQSWLFHRRVDQFEQMTDLPASLRTELAESITLWSTQIVKHSSANDGTEKLLLQLAAGGQIECVLLRDGVSRERV